jgi:hypothetical protein
MRKILIFAFIIFELNLNAQLKVTNVGNIGIGNNSPTYKLDVQGKIRFGYWGTSSTWEQVILDWENQWGSPTLYCNSSNNFSIGKFDKRVNSIVVTDVHYMHLYNDSDRRLKENIQPIGSTISRLNQVEAVSFSYKKNVNETSRITSSNENKINFGFIAQDIAKVFPELVQAPDSAFPYYSVNYVGMIPLLLEAIKEQQSIIDAQSLKIIELDNRFDLIESLPDSTSTRKSATISTITDTLLNSSNIDLLASSTVDSSNFLINTFLYQNNPNPFTVRTEIKYYINEGVNSASLIIFDMQGSLIKQIPIFVHGLGSTIIEGSEFKAGMYLYTLVTNNQEISTKRMILTE